MSKLKNVWKEILGMWNYLNEKIEENNPYEDKIRYKK